MPYLILSKFIQAPPETVFALFSDFANCAGRIEGIKKVAMLTDGPVGVGTRFKETRIMFGKETTEEMYLTAFDAPKSYTIGAQSCGAEFSTLFKFKPEGTGTRVDMEMSTRALSFFAKLMKPMAWLMKGMMRKCMDKDMEDLKKFAEGSAKPPAIT